MAAKKPSDENLYGDWQLIDKIARGGMGVAVKARNLKTKQVGVLKFLLPRDQEVDPLKLAAEFKRFKNEKEVLEKFNSEYISKFYDAKLDDNPPWIAMQYFAGTTIWDQIHDNGPIDEGKWWDLAHDLLSGLRYIHEHKEQRVHRDLNPKNVMLVFGGARIIDFGIARLEGADSSATHAFGFRGFTSPEHYTQAAHPMNDIFVAATVLAFAGTGKIPWKADTSGQYLGAIFNDSPSYKGLSEKQQVLLRALHQKNPAARPTASKALTLLESLTVMIPEKSGKPQRAIKQVNYDAQNVANLEGGNVFEGFGDFVRKNKVHLILGLFTGGWSLLFYWLWRQRKYLTPKRVPVSLQIAVSLVISLFSFGLLAFAPIFYWSKRFEDRKLFWIGFGTSFLSLISLIGMGSIDPDGEGSGLVLIYLGIIFFFVIRTHIGVYRRLKISKSTSDAKAVEVVVQISEAKESDKQIEVEENQPEDSMVTDSNLTTGDVSWGTVEHSIFQYLASRKGKQFLVEVISNKYQGLYFQGYSEPGGYITVEAASNVSVTPPLEIDNRKGLIKIGWEPPSEGLPNFIKFLDLKESENSEIAKLFVETLRDGYSLDLGTFKVDL